jgi:hypothetical protein
LAANYLTMPNNYSSRNISVIFVGALLFGSPLLAQSIRLNTGQAEEIGLRIWRNESGGTVSGLTAWNSGEKFASLGIGHFIWYPAGHREGFEESFPLLIDYFAEQSVSVPGWLKTAKTCPWPDRSAFLAAHESPRMRELRSLLAATVPVQARFAAARLESALPKMLAAVPSAQQDRIRTNFYRVAAEPLGMYALVDYVNFKGEGTLATERYNGEGWGLLQVLENMKQGPALPAFATSADRVLTRRVANSPTARGESRWLPGWKNRVSTYSHKPISDTFRGTGALNAG